MQFVYPRLSLGMTVIHRTNNAYAKFYRDGRIIGNVKVENRKQ